MPQNFYELVWIFIIYAFIGWCTEVSYAALDTGKFVNRGFLNGPYCPIYGCGVVVVVSILTPLKESLLILFIGSIILTTAIEFVTGYLLEKVFHNKWWDYSDKPFNIKGYICLKFSIYWGLACTFVMDVIHPMIYKGITLLPKIPGIIILTILMAVFAADCGITVSVILKFNKRLKIMDEMANTIHKLSDEIGENIYEGVTGVIEKSEEFQENHAELIGKITETTESAKERITDTTNNAKEKISDTTTSAKEKIADSTENMKNAVSENIMEVKNGISARKEVFTEKTAAIKKTLEEKKNEYKELNEKYEKLFEEKNFGFKRLMKAFPNMTSRDSNETLEKFKKHFNIKKTGEK